MSRLKFKYLYGPVSSWRLGKSLGVDLLGGGRKACTFDCVYCQLGRRKPGTRQRKVFVPTEKVIKEVRLLPRGIDIDYITFSGSGEPTLAKNLGAVIRGIRKIRDEKIAVITNSSLMRDKKVRQELGLADIVVAKLDAANSESFGRTNMPLEPCYEDICKGIRRFRAGYKTRLALQIMFYSANKKDYKKITDAAVRLRPDEIHVNTPLRPSGVRPLAKKDIFRIKKYIEEYARKKGASVRALSAYDDRRRNVLPLDMQATRNRRNAVEENAR